MKIRNRIMFDFCAGLPRFVTTHIHVRSYETWYAFAFLQVCCRFTLAMFGGRKKDDKKKDKKGEKKRGGREKREGGRGAGGGAGGGLFGMPQGK